MKAVFDSPEAARALEVYRDAQVGYGNPQEVKESTCIPWSTCLLQVI